MSRMLSDVVALAGEIGPRGTGTPGEEAAAHFVVERLAGMELPIEQQIFRAVASQNAFPLAIDALALLAFIIYSFGGRPGRWIGAGLALTTAPLLWQTIRTSGRPIRTLLPKVTSRNVVTRIEPSGETGQRVVLLAHLDTNRCRIVWQSTARRLLEPLAYLTLAMLASMGLLFLVGALLGGPRWVWWASLLPAGYAVGTVITLWKDDRAPYSPGAHDNAASVAVALEVGRRLVAQPLDRTQVWLAFTGAEETDHAGLYALLRRHNSMLRNAAFIGLEGLGSGDLVTLTRQGFCAHYTPDAGLLALAETVAAERPDLGVRPAQTTWEDEVGTLRRSGYRAICIVGLDPLTGTLPHWHRADDTPETTSGEFMERAAGFLMALLKALDGQVSSAREEDVCGRL